MEYNTIEEVTFAIGLFFMILACQDAVKDIFEFVLFKDYGNTHRFKRTYRKRPLLKRFFLLTVFDEELINKCRHERLLKKIYLADIIHLSLGIAVLIIKTYLIVTENAKYELAFVAYSVVLIVFYVWYLIHSVRGDEWVKGNWRAGQREFQIRLPDEEKPKKK
ncbi:MAG: hypothetical protein IJ395_08480 [Clostridia bacterium]|nr:hypothetical protein [Clostridia bacterium]